MCPSLSISVHVCVGGGGRTTDQPVRIPSVVMSEQPISPVACRFLGVRFHAFHGREEKTIFPSGGRVEPTTPHLTRGVGAAG